MRSVTGGVLGACGSLAASVSLALAAEGDAMPQEYRGITYVYYFVIILILAYGVYDTFFKKSEF
ncbi:MAG: hypothetical protein E6K61_07560 [Nitrospirae bacterium]|nr:MAG: hypothetical protein E6K61_07560 [Nitrospirota bacterium]